MDQAQKDDQLVAKMFKQGLKHLRTLFRKHDPEMTDMEKKSALFTSVLDTWNTQLENVQKRFVLSLQESQNNLVPAGLSRTVHVWKQ